MDNNCPKCGKKLSIFYIKQNCPDCGCDLLYYNMDKKLEEDSEKAEVEYEALYRFIARFKIKKKQNELGEI